ncbi:hypothetical protein SPHINGO8AM_70208 [Sphingomonas sp. 8AM]|nr:hypothetical protein SPHINGO8AM_70208 [Sphingomonas sp. 8AM]
MSPPRLLRRRCAPSQRHDGQHIGASFHRRNGDAGPCRQFRGTKSRATAGFPNDNDLAVERLQRCLHYYDPYLNY